MTEDTVIPIPWEEWHWKTYHSARNAFATYKMLRLIMTPSLKTKEMRKQFQRLVESLPQAIRKGQ